MSNSTPPNLEEKRQQAEIDKLEAERHKLDAETKEIERRSSRFLVLAPPLLSVLVGAVGGFFYFATVFRTVVERKVAVREVELDERRIELRTLERKLQEAQDRFSQQERTLLEERDQLARQGDRLEREKRDAVSRIQQLEASLRKTRSSGVTQEQLERLKQLREEFSSPRPMEVEETPRPADDSPPVESEPKPATPTPQPAPTPRPQDTQPAERSRASTLTDLLRRFARRDFYVAERIPRDKLQAARRAAGVPEDETVVALLVAEVLGPPQNVIVFGLDRFYYNHQRYSRGVISYEDLPDLQFKVLPNFVVDLGNGKYFNLAGSRVSPNTLVQILTALRGAEEGAS